MVTARRGVFTQKIMKLSELQKNDLLFDCYSHFDFWPKDSPFLDGDDRRRVWFEHRDSLLSLINGDSRPAGWWDYESKTKHKIVARLPLDEPQTCFHTGKVLSHHVIYERDDVALRRMGILN